MELNFKYKKEVPDFIIEELDKLRNSLLECLLPFYKGNDPRLFFSSLHSVAIEMTFHQFQKEEECMKAIQDMYNNFFNNYKDMSKEEANEHDSSE